MKAVEVPFLSSVVIEMDTSRRGSGTEGEGIAGATWDLDDRPLS